MKTRMPGNNGPKVSALGLRDEIVGDHRRPVYWQRRPDPNSETRYTMGITGASGRISASLGNSYPSLPSLISLRAISM